MAFTENDAWAQAFRIYSMSKMLDHLPLDPRIPTELTNEEVPLVVAIREIRHRLTVLEENVIEIRALFEETGGINYDLLADKVAERLHALRFAAKTDDR